MNKKTYTIALKTSKKLFSVIGCIALSLVILCLSSQASNQLPAKLQVALMLKAISLEKGIGLKPEVTIFVLDSPDIAEILEHHIGMKVGKGVLTRVESGMNIPQQRFDVIYIGNPLKAKDALAYSTKNKLLSIYPDSEKMDTKGTLGIGIKSGKPMFLLKLEVSKKEGLLWEPAIVRIAKKI